MRLSMYGGSKISKHLIKAMRGARETVQQKKCLSGKHKDLSSIPGSAKNITKQTKNSQEEEEIEEQRKEAKRRGEHRTGQEKAGDKGGDRHDGRRNGRG